MGSLESGVGSRESGIRSQESEVRRGQVKDLVISRLSPVPCSLFPTPTTDHCLLRTLSESCIWVRLGGIRLFLPDNSVSMFFHKK